MCTKMRLYFLFGYMSYDKQLIYIEQLVLLQNRRLIIEDVALLPSFVRNLGLPLQRSPNRNREFNAWSQGHKDNPGVCQDYQGEIEQRRGKVVSAD